MRPSTVTSTPRSLVGVQVAVVEAELHFLFDVAGEVVGRDPAGVNVEGGLAAVGVGVDHLQLHGVPGRAVRRADEAALARGGDAEQAGVRGAEREVDQLDVMDGDVGSGVAAHDPLGELPAADRFRLQQGAITVVDVPQHAVQDVGAQLLVVGVGQLVVDDLRQHLMPLGEGGQHVQLLKTQHRRLLDEDVFAGGQRLTGGVKMPVVRRGDANHVHAPREQLRDGVRPGAADERPDAAGGGLAIEFGAGAGAAGDDGQFHLDGAEIAAVEAVGVQVLEDGAVGFVEDHAQAGHADPETTGMLWRVHRRIITRRRRERKKAIRVQEYLHLGGPCDARIRPLTLFRRRVDFFRPHNLLPRNSCSSLQNLIRFGHTQPENVVDVFARQRRGRDSVPEPTPRRRTPHATADPTQGPSRSDAPGNLPSRDQRYAVAQRRRREGARLSH